MEQEETKGKVLGYNKKTLIAAAVLVIVAGGTFYVGAKYEKNKLSKLGLLNSVQTIDVCKTKDSVTGELITKSDNTLAIKTTDGAIQNVFISVSMKSGKKSSVALENAAIGQQVVIGGVKNSDGSFSAQSIEPAASATQTK